MKVISFSSGKGGVGKTTIVTNLAFLYAKNGKRTLIIDGDWHLGKVAIMLGVKPKLTIDKIFSSSISINDVIHEVVPNLSILPAPSGELNFNDLNEKKRNELYFEFEKLYGMFDIALFDHASGVSEGVLQFAAASHQHVIVTTTEPTSYTDAYAIIKMLSLKYGIRKFSLIVTQSNNIVEAERVISRFSELIFSNLNVSVNLLEIIPWEDGFTESIKRKRPFVVDNSYGSTAYKLSKVVEKLEKEKVPVTGGLSLFFNHRHNSTWV